MTRLTYTDPEAATAGAPTRVLVGTKARLLASSARVPSGLVDAWRAMVEGARPGDRGACVETWTGAGEVRRLVACVLPARVSRHNSPARPHAVAGLLKKPFGAKGDVAVLLAVESADQAFAAGCAVARSLPLYDAKTRKGDALEEREVRVAVLSGDPVDPGLTRRLDAAGEGIRLAARLVDTPPAELHTDAFLEELRAIADASGADLEVVRGDDLERRGYGGLWNVGRTALHPPALAILTHEPPGGADATVAWVGKGIVYDTGGLSLKGKVHMPGMKADMGGAAAVAGAFQAAAELGFDRRVHALFCLAENSIGPDAMRPDDVIRVASGKSVEVNNTDAEGRLVLADGVAHAVAHLAPDVIVDLATLTGAQLTATGRRHAGLVTNDEDWEARATRAGRSSGDLVHPLPYCPEFFRKEFKSKVADLKNSVKDRSNAQSACAAQFIAEHLGDFDGAWVHVDMAGPATADERGTGFGVALLLELFGVA